MDVSWAFVVLLVYPALQVPAVWLFVRHFDLRNDDGPDPGGYSFHADGGTEPGECHVCGAANPEDVQLCWSCQSRLP